MMWGVSPGASRTQSTCPSTVRMNISGQRNLSAYFSASSSLMEQKSSSPRPQMKNAPLMMS